MSLTQLALLVGALYYIVILIRRVYFSPISHIPGPKLAAASHWYQFYYDVALKGQYIWKVRDLHEKYGPIVRISPYEVHVNDPNFADELYSGPGTHKRDKWAWATRGIGVDGAVLTTPEHNLHKVRRAALNPFFSKGAIRKLQPLFDAKIEYLIERFEEFRVSKDVIVLNHAFAALTNGTLTGRFCNDMADRNPQTLLRNSLSEHQWTGSGILDLSLDSMTIALQVLTSII